MCNLEDRNESRETKNGRNVSEMLATVHDGHRRLILERDVFIWISTCDSVIRL